MLARHPELRGVWDAAHQAFPIAITRSFWDRMRGDLAGPLARQVLPDARELQAHPDDVDDPVGDDACSPVPWVVHKYPSRVLLLVTKRCHLYCRYCFRRNHDPSDAVDPTDDELAAAVAYARHAGVQEVILSGGDPLAVNDRRLARVLDELDGCAPVLRIHTRAPITAPWRVTDELVALLRERQPVWVVVHCNHPDELAPDVDEALAKLVDAGIPVLNQSVLLRGVNDDVDVLAELCQGLVRRRVFPYYLHHPDAAQGNAHQRLSQAEGLALWEQLRARVSGVALPRYVVDPPDGSGKRDVQGARR